MTRALLLIAIVWPLVPDPRLTPGAVFPAITSADVCRPGYASQARHVTAAGKAEVYRRYHISKTAGVFEIDHLIPLTLGGNNTPNNLWPESFDTVPWNAAVKDKLEVRLNTLVCRGALALAVAQQAIATDWRVAYRTYYETLVGRLLDPP